MSRIGEIIREIQVWCFDCEDWVDLVINDNRDCIDADSNTQSICGVCSNPLLILKDTIKGISCLNCIHADREKDYSGDTIDCKRSGYTVNEPWNMKCSYIEVLSN